MTLDIRKTATKDLENVAALWNDGDTMRFVGFPEGLGVTIETLHGWLKKINGTPYTEHFSIYETDLGYCGETFYSADDRHRLAALDIKLFKKSRGKGIAKKALKHAILRAFDTGVVDTVYVDPSPDNEAALALYRKLGFKRAQRPAFLEPAQTHFELDKKTFDETKRKDKGE